VDLTRVFRYRGPLDITIEDAHYRADSRFTGDVDMPEFNRATAAIELNYEEVRLHDIRCYGPENSLRITGMIYQRLPVRNTWLELELRLYMSGAPDMTSDEGYIPLKIKGPVKDPDILFLGRNLRNQSVMPRLDD